MQATEITQGTLTEVRDAITAKSVSSVEATQAYLDRIEAVDGGLNCYHEVYTDRALARAKAADAGQLEGPLAGVPVAIKDILCTDFGTTTCSSKMLEGFASPYTATAVKNLEAAGAVILGKTNMDEFAMGSSTETCAFGNVQNPWDKQRTPGGSSGGSASAVAAGLCAGSFGTDTGGSIRQPAALCGVVGLKPTYGRVSRYGLVAFASSLDQIGPFGRCVSDAALLMQAVAGHDPRDSTSADVAVEADLAEVDAAPKSLRIGIAKQYLTDANHPAVAASMDEALAVYKDAGAEIVEVDLPSTEYGIPTYYIVATAEASSNLARYDGVHYGHRTEQAEDLIDLYAKSRAEGFGDEVKRRIMLGTYALQAGYESGLYNRALRVRRVIANELADAFTRCDALLCPTTTGPAFKLGENNDDPVAMYLNDIYTVNANLAGIPGISLPGGFAEEGGTRLPVGVQLFAPAFAERELFRLARVYEKSVTHHEARPTL